jgi:hypothetical protein
MQVTIGNKGMNSDNVTYLNFEIEDCHVISDYYGHTSGLMYASGNARVFPDNSIELEFNDSHVYIVGNNGEEIADFEDWEYCKNEIIVQNIKDEIINQLGER